MVLQKYTPAIALTLLFASPATPNLLADALRNNFFLAQSPASPTAFPLPGAVPSGTIVRIDGATSMIVINETLKERFEQQYVGSQVTLQTKGTDAALQALRDGGIDLAAVGRPLTQAEKAEGFVEVPISREKIAIITSPENPFNGNLTFAQFAQIFRGEITNWSELGGTPGAIRFVDRPDTSDTRQALSNYQVFKSAPFETGANTTQVDQDDTTAVIQELGQNGISYAIASQVLDQPNVKVIRMHSTLPDDPRYPFSQPRGYVYFKTATPAAQAFLGYATAPAGQAAVTEAKLDEAAAVASGEAVTTAAEGASDAAAAGVGVGVLGSGLIAFSPDGQAIASAAEDTAQLWDLTGKPLGQLRHGATVTSVAYNPTGNGLLTAGKDGNLRLWSAQGEPVGEPLEAHDGGVKAAVFSPDGQTIASGGEDGTVKLWSADGQPLGNPLDHQGKVAAIAFSPDGQTIASGGEGTIRRWDVQGNPVGTPITVEGEVSSLAFSPDGQAIAVADADGTIRLWDLQGNPMGQPIQTGGDVTSLGFSPDGRTLLATGEDGTLQLWGLQGDLVGKIFNGDEAIAAAFSPDGQTIAGVGEDGVVTLVSAEGTPVGEPFGGDAETGTDRGFPLWLVLLIPIALLALLLWWLSKRRTPSEPTDTSTSTAVGTTTPTTAAPSPSTEGTDLASRVGSVIASDRESISGERSSVAASPSEGTATPPAAETINPDFPVIPPAATPVDTTPPVEATAPVEATDAGMGAAIAGGAALAAGAGVGALPLLTRLVSGGDSQLTLTPYSPNQVQARWTVSNTDRAIAQQQGGQQFAVRLYDVTGLDLETQAPHSVQQITADEQTQPLLLAIPTDERDYLAEVGYTAADGQWLALARSNAVRLPSGFDNAATVVATPPTDTPTQVAAALLDQADGAFPTPTSPPALGIGGAALAAGLGAAATASLSGDDDQSLVEASKFNVGQTDLSAEALADVDANLPDLPEGYGESRIVLMPRDPQWAYAYWDVPNNHKEELRRQGGERLALRLYDVTDIDLNAQRPHSLQEFACEEMARDWYLPIPVSDRDYVAEIGYLTAEGRWLMLARSAPAHIPPVYPSDWFEEHFMTISWDEDLRGRTLYTLIPPSQRSAIAPENPLYDRIFDMAQSAEAQRVAGSLYGSMQMVPGQAISSYVFPSGVGMWALPTMSMSGIGMSGIGFSASVPAIRPRKFWLVADAELIVYGATEPDATVTIGDRVIQLSPDGTFRFQMSFQDGFIDYPIQAVAADGEQTRSIHMEFERETPERRTNTKDEAIDEWL